MRIVLLTPKLTTHTHELAKDRAIFGPFPSDGKDLKGMKQSQRYSLLIKTTTVESMQYCINKLDSGLPGFFSCSVPFILDVVFS